jgi:membrane fusion protein, multidrug efflux system
MILIIRLQMLGMLFFLSACNKTPAPQSQINPNDVSLRQVVIESNNSATSDQYSATVESVNHADLAAQVTGRVVNLYVKEGDKVKQNQLLAKLDSQAAGQATLADKASLSVAQAQLDLARAEYARKQQLFAKNYISKGALDQAEASLQSAEGIVKAQDAQAKISGVQTEFYTIKSPFNGVIGSVPITIGDMALPGTTLITLYDQSKLRVKVLLPQSLASTLNEASVNKVTILVGSKKITPVDMKWLPESDPLTHSRELRINLPPNLVDVMPGMNVLVNLPSVSNTENKSIWIPRSALVSRSEMKGVYVISATGIPLLRQVRVGSEQDDQIEILTGLSAGDRLALDPEIAAGVH